MRSFVFLLCVSSGLALSPVPGRAEPLVTPTPSPRGEPSSTSEAASPVSTPEPSSPAPEPIAPLPAAPESAARESAAPASESVGASAPGPEPAAGVASGAAGASAPPELTELTARIQALERIEPLDDSVQRPVDFAKAALERSRTSKNLGDLAAEARTRQLGRAAVELAESRLRLLRERALFQATQARRNAGAVELATAKLALERERARARELERESAAP